MPSCLTIIDNYISNTQISIAYADADYSRVDRHWHGSDILLRELNDNGHFQNHDTWAALSVDEWYVLLARTIDLFAELPESEQFDTSNSTVQSFNFIIIGMLKRIHLDTKQITNYVRLQIMQNGEFSINLSSNINLVSGQRSKPTLRVV